MAEEKRVKLGVDLGELSNQLLQVNTLVEQNYQAAVRGQQEYNKILEESITLLQQQAELIPSPQSSQQQLSNVTVGEGGSSQGMSEGDIRKYLILIDRVRGTMNTDDQEDNQHDNEIADKTLTVLEKILATTENIWEKYSQEIMPSGEGKSTQERNTREGEEKQGRQEGEAPQQEQQQGGQRGGAGIQSTVLGGVNQGLSILGQSDPNYILPGVVSMIPYVGSGLGAILQNLISAAEKQDVATSKFRGVTGRDYSARGLAGIIGLNEGEVAEKLAQYTKARSEASSYDLMFEKGYGLNAGIIDALLRSTRQERIDGLKQMGSSSIFGEAFLQDLTNKGQIKSKEVRAYSEDYLKILVDLNQKQLELTGETNSILNSDVVASIARLDDHFGDPTVLSRVVSNLQGGLTQARSPQIEAMQYWALAETNPGASLWQMQMMRETPFSEESRGYLSNFLSGMLKTGNIDDVKFNIQHTFGLSAHQTEYLVEGILSAQRENKPEFQDIEGKFDLRKYLEINKVDFSPDAAEAKISAEAVAATSGTEKTLAGMEDFMAGKGSDLIGRIDPALTQAVVGGVADLTDGVLDIADSIKKFFQGVNDFGDFVDKLGEKIGGVIKDNLPNMFSLDSLNPFSNNSTPSNPKNE